jgi:hypothetical protein
MGGATHGGIQQCRGGRAVEQTDGIFEAFIRIQFHHDPAGLGDAHLESDQPRHRRWWQDAVADRAHGLQPGHACGRFRHRPRRLPLHHPMPPRIERKQVENLHGLLDAARGHDHPPLMARV